MIINCVRFLCPEANSKFLEKLFRVLVQSLEREVDKPLTVLWRGIEQPVLLGLTECCIAYVRKKFGIKLRVKLPRKPLRKAKSVAKIWRGVGKSVSKKPRRDPQHRRLHLALDRGLRRDTEDHAPVRTHPVKGCCGAPAAQWLAKESDTIWIPRASCFSSASHEERISRQCETALLH